MATRLGDRFGRVDSGILLEKMLVNNNIGMLRRLSGRSICIDEVMVEVGPGFVKERALSIKRGMRAIGPLRINKRKIVGDVIMIWKRQ